MLGLTFASALPELELVLSLDPMPWTPGLPSLEQDAGLACFPFIHQLQALACPFVSWHCLTV